MTVDRRIQKTKKYLAEALLQLIGEKGYDAVTVQDIIDRADVGRSTFYSHYENKEQLLVGNINFQRELMDTPLDDDQNYPMGINLVYLFNHTREHLKAVHAMLGTRGLDILAAHFSALIAAKIVEYHEHRFSSDIPDKKMLRYRSEAKAGGIVRMLFKWLEDGAVIPADDMIIFAEKILSIDKPGETT